MPFLPDAETDSEMIREAPAVAGSEQESKVQGLLAKWASVAAGDEPYESCHTTHGANPIENAWKPGDRAIEEPQVCARHFASTAKHFVVIPDRDFAEKFAHRCV